ncbi:MAG: hypothetical protein PHS47_02970 [Methanocellales archaeon]|nr:hypothetical protein [Methanocellales archaeon]MDD3421244.1 hypothetical protein [Methanocellales archaeon]MDD4898541.1 hypothetical protein [Methanocellales archaeon]MDD5447355.1 hypothetical protein [Methanocellales archaeon]
MFLGIVCAFLAKGSVRRKVQTDLGQKSCGQIKCLMGRSCYQVFITLGALTDTPGFMLLIPCTRAWTKEQLKILEE